MKGYVQVYTGDSKEANPEIGLCLRAAGAGLKVLIARFFKKGEDSMIKALERFSGQISVEDYCTDYFVKGSPSEEDLAAARQGMNRIRLAVCSRRYDMVIIQEGNAVVHCGLLSAEAFLEIIRDRPASVELVITGQGADPRIIEAADLVTEITELKHQPKRGARARTGIEK